MSNEEAIECLKNIDILSFRDRAEKYFMGDVYEALDMAIKALEQQPCEDCISREAAIYAFERFIHELGIKDEPYNYGEMALSVQNVPSVTPQSRWIPVSEVLPKENEYIRDVWKYYLIQDEYGDMHVAHLSNVGWIPMDSLKAIGDEIIAWMPLPKPYEEVEDADSD